MPRSLPRAIFRLLLATALLGLTACSRAPTAGVATLPQDAYIWQRQWTPALRAAISASSPALARWRVLGAELGVSGRWIDIDPDPALLGSVPKPLVLVVRINGQLARFDSADIERHIQQRLVDWRARGLAPAMLEIDYDCATAKLPAYAALLSHLKPQLDVPLSITALPTWLDSPQLGTLLAVPDMATLQVHAVLDARQGLFDPERARAWIDQFARRTTHPWYVALPAYGARVVWDGRGRIAAVESETPTLVGGMANELIAPPAQLAGFAAQLERDLPRGLAGIAWFRLPTGDDRRAWSLSTWLAVLQRQPLQADVMVRLAASGADQALRDIVLDNPGNADAPLPLRIRLEAGCANADGINGYALDRDAQGPYLRRTQAGLLRPGARRNVGWLRCQSGPGQLKIDS